MWATSQYRGAWLVQMRGFIKFPKVFHSFLKQVCIAWNKKLCKTRMGGGGEEMTEGGKWNWRKELYKLGCVHVWSSKNNPITGQFYLQFQAAELTVGVPYLGSIYISHPPADSVTLNLIAPCLTFTPGSALTFTPSITALEVLYTPSVTCANVGTLYGTLQGPDAGWYEGKKEEEKLKHRGVQREKR